MTLRRRWPVLIALVLLLGLMGAWMRPHGMEAAGKPTAPAAPPLSLTWSRQIAEFHDAALSPQGN